MLSALLAAGAAVNYAMTGGSTSLHAACRKGHAEVVSALLAAGVAVDKMRETWTALHDACHNGYLACAKLLFSYLASRSGNGGAHAVADRVGHHDVSTWLMLSHEWSSPLHHLEIISAGRARDLLRAGADIGAAAREGGPTPLSLAHALGEAGKAVSGSAAELVLRASEPWSPETHYLFPPTAQSRAVELLRLGVLLSSQPRFRGAEGALVDVWIEGVIPSAVDRLT